MQKVSNKKKQTCYIVRGSVIIMVGHAIKRLLYNDFCKNVKISNFKGKI